LALLFIMFKVLKNFFHNLQIPTHILNRFLIIKYTPFGSILAFLVVSNLAWRLVTRLYVVHIYIHPEGVMMVLLGYGVLILFLVFLYPHEGVRIIRISFSIFLLIIGFILMYLTTFLLVKYESVEFIRRIPLLDNLMLEVEAIRRVHPRVILDAAIVESLKEAQLALSSLSPQEIGMLRRLKTPDDIDRVVGAIKREHGTLPYLFQHFL
jgi:hypothetical protein